MVIIINNATVTYEDGNVITTRINGTIPEVQRYFAIGKKFNIGSVKDNVQKVKSLTINSANDRITNNG